MEQIELNYIINQILIKMKDFKLSKSTIKSYKYSAFSPIRHFFEENNQIYYVKEIIDEFLLIENERMNDHKISERHYRILRKASEMIEEYHTTRTLIWSAMGNCTKLK